MIIKITRMFLLSIALLSTAAPLFAQVVSSGVEPSTQLLADNPFAKPSTLPFQVPAFDKIKDEHFRPAFDAGMAEHKKEIQAIAHNPEPATFENTIVAMEKSGLLLDRVSTVFFNLDSSNNNPEILKIASEMAPKLAAHGDSITLDPALFARIDAVYKNRASLKLDPESLQLLERTHLVFVRAGANLSDADKTKLKQINEQIASLNNQFQQNVLKATKDAAVVVDNVAELDGLSTEQIGAAAEAAKTRKL